MFVIKAWLFLESLYEFFWHFMVTFSNRALTTEQNEVRSVPFCQFVFMTDFQEDNHYTFSWRGTS